MRKYDEKTITNKDQYQSYGAVDISETTKYFRIINDSVYNPLNDFESSIAYKQSHQDYLTEDLLLRFK